MQMRSSDEISVCPSVRLSLGMKYQGKNNNVFEEPWTDRSPLCIIIHSNSMIIMNDMDVDTLVSKPNIDLDTLLC